MRVLTGANVIRQAAGLSAEQTADQSRAETAAAFEQLESGLGSFGASEPREAGGGRREAGPQAGWRVASCWLITVETPSPRMVMP